MNPLKVDIYKHKKNEEEGSTHAYTKIYSRAHKKSFLLLPGRDYLTVYSHTALPYVEARLLICDVILDGIASHTRTYSKVYRFATKTN